MRCQQVVNGLAQLPPSEPSLKRTGSTTSAPIGRASSRRGPSIKAAERSRSDGTAALSIVPADRGHYVWIDRLHLPAIARLMRPITWSISSRSGVDSAP